MRFRLVPKSVTLNGVRAVTLCYSTEFDSFACQLGPTYKRMKTDPQPTQSANENVVQRI